MGGSDRWYVLAGSSSLLWACASGAPAAADPTDPVVVELRIDPLGAPKTSEASGAAPRSFDRAAFLLLPPELNRRQPGARLACEPELVRHGERLSVAVAGSEVALPSETIRFPSSGELELLPYNDKGVMFAYHTPEYPTLQSHSVLFWLECGGAHRLFAALVAPEAEFGRALLGAAGRWLYYPDAAGLQRLDMDTFHERDPQVVRVLSNQPEYRPACWGGADIETPYLFPDAWLVPDQRLSALIFAPCGFEGDPEAHRATVLELGTREPLVVRHSPVASVIVDAQGTLWLGDGGEFESPGVTDPGTTGFVWSSRDGGEKWLPVDFGGSSPAGQLATQGSSLIVLESRRASVIEVGGDLHLSRDGGRTWRELPLDPAGLIENSDSNGYLFEQFEVSSWSPLHVTVWRVVNGEEQTLEAKLSLALEQAGGEVARGTLWRRVSPRPRPARTDRTARARGHEFRAANEGLVRTGAGGERVVFRTIDHWRATDWQGIVDEDGSGGSRAVVPEQTASAQPAHAWRWGCRSRRELRASNDVQVKQWLRAPLLVRGVSRGDVLHLRRAASPQARVVSELAPGARGLAATGNVCKYEQSYWVQVRAGEHVGWANGRYLGADQTGDP